MPHFLVIGGGPAGLRAAELASAHPGLEVTLCDQKPSVGRKFLVAGKGGLNLTHSEDPALFATRYLGPKQATDFWENALQLFNNQDLRKWAADLGVETFTQKSGRVYPTSLKAAPLLRRWIHRLREQGVTFRMNHRLIALTPGKATFTTPEGPVTLEAEAIILALGGGSWPQTGSDGKWTALLESLGLPITPLAPANCGWQVPWPPDLLPKIEGQALKNLIASVGPHAVPGELVITRYGLEGGPIYALGPHLRDLAQPTLTLDFKPTFSATQLATKMESVRKNFLSESQTRWKLPDPVRLILDHFHGPFLDLSTLIRFTKACPLPLLAPQPLTEAISTAGGVPWSALTPGLMLKSHPGIYLAGEMIDWEAPTGGYLLQGAFTTATLATQTALQNLSIA